MPTILDVNFGREFFGWPETLEKQGRKIRYQNPPSKFAEKFAGNFPKIRQTKITNFTPCITSGPTCVLPAEAYVFTHMFMDSNSRSRSSSLPINAAISIVDLRTRVNTPFWYLKRLPFEGSIHWKAERCRTASWRNFQFFGIIFASQKGMLRGFHPCHIDTLDFALCPRWIFWRKFLEAVLQERPLKKSLHFKFENH